MLVTTAVNKARGDLVSAAGMPGLTLPQFADRLKWLHQGCEARSAHELNNNLPAIQWL